MSKKTTYLITIIILLSLALTGCTGSGARQETNYDLATPILDRVQERGKLLCGGRTDLLGFGYLDEDGNNIGFDIDICRAVAAAVLGDPDAIEVVDLPADQRGTALNNREIDLLVRNVTWTSSRDIEWGDFSLIMFFDGQRFMTRADSGIFTWDDFGGKSVCVTKGTTTEQNTTDFFAQNNLDFIPVVFSDGDAVFEAYLNGECDLITSDRSQLAARQSTFDDPGAHIIIAGDISKEPLTPVVPHGDSQWADIVRLVMMALINAEELGITQANIENMKLNGDFTVRRLLGEEGDWGYSRLGLNYDSLANAISATGNYGEIYNRYMGPEGIAFSMPRELNNLWTHGGLIYAPPIK